MKRINNGNIRPGLQTLAVALLSVTITLACLSNFDGPYLVVAVLLAAPIVIDGWRRSRVHGLIVVAISVLAGFAAGWLVDPDFRILGVVMILVLMVPAFALNEPRAAGCVHSAGPEAEEAA